MAISIYVVEMSEDAGSLPSDKDAHVTTWFDEHFVLTDGAFRKTKSTYEKRFLTVTNLETLYEHYTFHALSAGVDEIPNKLTFAYILQTKRGVHYKFVKNKWVGAIKRAANARPKRPSGDALLAYRHLRAQARAIQAVAPDAPDALDLKPALFEEFRFRQ